MEKDILQQYCDIREEIKLVERRIGRLRQSLSAAVHDTVKGSAAEFPYTARIFHTEGHDVNQSVRIERELKAQELILQQRYEELMAVQTQVEAYIAGIKKSRIRNIFTLRYLEGYNWVQVAHRMGGNNTADNCRKVHDRFLEKNLKNL